MWLNFPLIVALAVIYMYKKGRSQGSFAPFLYGKTIFPVLLEYVIFSVIESNPYCFYYG